MQRNLTAPAFHASEANGKLTITTASVTLVYVVGQPFAAGTLTVTSADPASAFKSWTYGDAASGNLLGTIRGLDTQVTPRAAVAVVGTAAARGACVLTRVR
jgi:hypothetical protein